MQTELISRIRLKLHENKIQRDLKIQIYYCHFSLIYLQELSNPMLLRQCVNATLKGLKYLMHVFASNCNLNMSTLWYSSNSVQKALDLTIPCKIEEK